METRPDRYWTGLERLIAAIIDGMLLSLPLFILFEGWTVYHLLPDSFRDVYLYIKLQVFPILTTFLPIAYSIYMHYRYGQTIGKMVMKIKVVDLSENKSISLKQAVQRDSIWIVLQLLDFVIEYYRLDDLHKLRMTDVNNVAICWTLLQLISMLTNSKRRAIHDFVAGTVVIKENSIYQTSKTYQ